MRCFRAPKFLLALALVAGAWILPAAAQIPSGGVGQSGSVTANDCAAWVGNGLIKDSGGSCGSLTVGTTTISGGTNPYILYDNNGVLGNLQTIPVANGGTNCTSASITCFNNITGFTAAGTTGTTSTNLVFSTSPVLVTPALGVATATSLELGNTGATLATGEFDLAKISASASAPGAGNLKIAAVAGTNANTCKIIAYAGTSTTPVTIIDNVGSGC
jgi:predicted RecA/RadA family phage recombinase